MWRALQRTEDVSGDDWGSVDGRGGSKARENCIEASQTGLV